MATIDVDELYGKWVESLGEERINLKLPSLTALRDWFLRECELKEVDEATQKMIFTTYVDPCLLYEENKRILSEIIAKPLTREEIKPMYEYLRSAVDELSKRMERIKAEFKRLVGRE